MELWITRHAQDKMILLGISEHDIEKTIRRGSQYKQTDGKLAVYAYICVAYKKIRNKYLIKTVFVK